jgi:hypothetical protein
MIEPCKNPPLPRHEALRVGVEYTEADESHDDDSDAVHEDYTGLVNDCLPRETKGLHQ